MEVVALAHGVHFLHLLTTVLPPVLIPVSCGSYPALSGSQVILKPLSRGFLGGQERMLLKFPLKPLIEITKTGQFSKPGLQSAYILETSAAGAMAAPISFGNFRHFFKIG